MSQGVRGPGPWRGSLGPCPPPDPRIVTGGAGSAAAGPTSGSRSDLPLQRGCAHAMISIKSPREIELMAIAGSIVGKVHKKMAEIIKPGISTLEIDRIAEKVIRDNDATPSFKNYQ